MGVRGADGPGARGAVRHGGVSDGPVALRAERRAGVHGALRRQGGARVAGGDCSAAGCGAGGDSDSGAVCGPAGALPVFQPGGGRVLFGDYAGAGAGVQPFHPEPAEIHRRVQRNRRAAGARPVRPPAGPCAGLLPGVCRCAAGLRVLPGAHGLALRACAARHPRERRAAGVPRL